GGGLLGVLLAVAAVRIALAHAPPDIPQLQWVRLDGPTFAAAGGFTLLAALIAGVVPGLRLTGRAATPVANAGYRATDDRRDRRLQAALVASQVALAATLLVGAGLLVRSFSALTSIDMGYTIEGIRMMRVDIPPDGFDDLPSRLAFVDGIRERLAARPEVAAVAFGTTAPQHGLNNYTTGVTILDRVVQEGAERPHGYIRAVTPGYFDVFGLSIEEGRGLNSGDVGPEGARAVVVSRAFAERFLPDGAIGQRLVITGDTVEVVGLTAGMRFAWPGEPPEPEFFLPYYGRFSPIVLVARGPNEDALARAIRAEVRATDRRIPLDRVPSLRELFGQTVAGPRFAATLLTLLAAIAVGIAALGIYSVLSFLVARRRREIGVRIALGATAGAVRRMLLAHGGRLAALGLIGGLALAWSTGQLLEGFLFEVTTHDPVVFVGVPVALGLVALAASLLPALRATRVDPATSIREDA
ncbi:MAG: FtsX-like permease family protein, partial [Gemmatimonadota bacterium]